MALVDVDELKRQLAGIVALEREIQQKTDRRGEGWKVIFALRTLQGHLAGAVDPDDPQAAAYVEKARAVVAQRLVAMEQGDLYNRISVEIHERTELDLFVLQKHLANEDHTVRMEAVAAAGELEYQAALPSLLALLDKEEHLWVISKLTKVVGQLGGAAVMEQLVRFLGHEDARVRANTIEGLETIPGNEKFTYIMPLLEDEAPRVRANALKAIRALGGPKFTELIRGMIRHPDFDHRRSALYVLAAMNNDFSRDCLRIMLDDDHPDLRARAIDLLCRQPTPVIVDALVKMLRDGCGEMTREKVMQSLQALAASPEPELAAYVTAALRKLEEPESEPEPEEEPESHEPAADTGAAGADSGSFRVPDTKKILARMSTMLSTLDPKERRDAENLIKAGKISNESQLKTLISRARKKKRGK